MRLDTLVLYDARTRSRWGLLTGEAFEGPLAGQRLRRLSGPLAGRSLSAVPATTGFWHAWTAHHPDTLVKGLPPD